MLFRRSADFWFGAAFIAFSAFIFSQTFGLSRSVVSNSIESAFFPRILLAGIAGMGAVLMLRDFSKQAPPTHERPRTLHLRPIILFFGISAYIAVMPYVGYYAATGFLIPLTLFIFGERRLVMHVTAVTLFLIVSYGLFDHGLGVLFPKGSFWGR